MDERSFIGIVIAYHLYRIFPIIEAAMNGRDGPEVYSRMSRGRMTPLFFGAIAVPAAILAAEVKRRQRVGRCGGILFPPLFSRSDAACNRRAFRKPKYPLVIMRKEMKRPG
jgi:hypothetical protein